MIVLFIDNNGNSSSCWPPKPAGNKYLWGGRFSCAHIIILQLCYELSFIQSHVCPVKKMQVDNSGIFIAAPVGAVASWGGAGPARCWGLQSIPLTGEGLGWDWEHWAVSPLLPPCCDWGFFPERSWFWKRQQQPSCKSASPWAACEPGLVLGGVKMDRPLQL